MYKYPPFSTYHRLRSTVLLRSTNLSNLQYPSLLRNRVSSSIFPCTNNSTSYRTILIPGYALPVPTYEFFNNSLNPATHINPSYPSHSSSSTMMKNSSESLTSPSSVATTIIPRSQWTIGRINYGLDDYGLPIRKRLKFLREIIVKKQNNFILLDGDELLKRCTNGHSSANPSTTVTINGVVLPIPSVAPMERSILQELFDTNKDELNIHRSQLVIGIQLSAYPSQLPNTAKSTTTSPPKITIENQLDASVQYLLKILGLSSFDIVILHFPQTKNTVPTSNASSFQLTPERGPKLLNYLSWLETCVGKGFTQYYGLNIDLLGGISSTLTNSSTKESSPSSSPPPNTTTNVTPNNNNNLDDLYVRLEQLLFASIGRIKGQAKRIRQETLVLGNTVDYFSSKEENVSEIIQPPNISTNTAFVQSTGIPSIPVQDDHHLIMLLSPGNLLRWGPLLPRTATRSGTAMKKGYETWSQILASYQISQFLHHPLDVVHQGKAFRCVGLSFYRDVMKQNLYQRAIVKEPNNSKDFSSTIVQTTNGYHPADIAPYLQDSFNNAIALETVWDNELKANLMNQYPLLQILPSRTVAWARILGSNLQTMDSSMTWSFIKHVHILSAIENLLELFPDNDKTPMNVRQWIKDYQKHMYDIIRYIDILMGQIQAERIHKVFEILQDRLSLLNNHTIPIPNNQPPNSTTDSTVSSSSRSNYYSNQNLASIVINMLLNNEGQIQGVFTEIPEAYGMEPDSDMSQYPYRIVLPDRSKKHNPSTAIGLGKGSSSSSTAPDISLVQRPIIGRANDDDEGIAQPFNNRNELSSRFTPLDIGKLLPTDIHDKLLDAMVGKPPISF